MLAAVQIVEDPIRVLIEVGEEEGSPRLQGRPHPPRTRQETLTGWERARKKGQAPETGAPRWEEDTAQQNTQRPRHTHTQSERHGQRHRNTVTRLSDRQQPAPTKGVGFREPQHLASTQS